MKVTNDRMPGNPTSHRLRLGWSVRITTRPMIGGTGYDIHRCGDDFRAEVRKLAPWLARACDRVWIPDATSMPGVALTIDPLDSVLEEEFILRMGRFLVEA